LITQQEREELKRIEAREKARKEKLPHLYGMPWYQWAWEFRESRNRNNFLCAANQISKSSTQIRKCIHWATETELWPELWPSRPTQFWYFYPDANVATAEFEEKWVKEFLPREEMKTDFKYGWKEEYDQRKKILRILFNSGVTVYFKTYEQDPLALQAASVYAIFGDEEMPEEIYNEVTVRRNGAMVQGHFHLVFTATLGLEFWRETIEEKGDGERFKGAFKRQVSLYDSLKYMDGSASPWTIEKINQIIAECKDEDEVQRRVWGRFVLDKNKKYASFQASRNVKPSHPLPKSWLIYAGVDIGSGGLKGHPAAICFVGVKPDFTEGRVFLCWRGDKVETTAGDIYVKYRELKGGMKPVAQYYDWASKDFKTITDRVGGAFMPANKDHDVGEDLLNTLFKNNMLIIYDSAEAQKLVRELQNLKNSTPKRVAKDDLIDALRYAISSVPWNFEAAMNLRLAPLIKKTVPTDTEVRRNRHKRSKEGLELLGWDVDEINEYYGEGVDDGFF
jgi:hypothetical protein